MRYTAPVVVASLALAIVAACSSQPDKPARTVNCAGGVPMAAPGPVADAGGSCLGICLTAHNPCADVELADGGSSESCPSGYAFAPSRATCAGGASCCLPVAVDGGRSASDAAATDATATDAAADSPAD